MQRFEPGIDPSRDRQRCSGFERTPVGRDGHWIVTVAEASARMARIGSKQAMHSRRACAHLAHHHDGRGDRGLCEFRFGAPDAAQGMPFADRRRQLAIGHGVTQRVEVRFGSQAGAEDFKPFAEIRDLGVATTGRFVSGFETATADLPQIGGLESGFRRDAAIPQRLQRPDRPVGRSRAGKRVRAGRQRAHAA